MAAMSATTKPAVSSFSSFDPKSSDRAANRAPATYGKIEVLRNDDNFKTVSVTGLTFTITAQRVAGGWISNGVMMPDGKVAGASIAVSTSWKEIFDIKNVRSIGQSLGREMREAIEPTVRTSGGGKPNVSALRSMFEATVDGMIEDGDIEASQREAKIEKLLNREIERRNAREAEKAAAGKASASAPGALTGVQAGNGGTAR